MDGKGRGENMIRIDYHHRIMKVPRFFLAGKELALCFFEVFFYL